MKRRTIVMLLCLSLVLFGCGRKQTAATTAAPEVPFGNYIQPAESFAGGSGTQEDPFQIETVRQLALLAEVINRNYDVEHYDDEQLYRYGYYVLTADIVLNDPADFDTWQEAAPQYAWEPIGCKGEDGLLYEFRGVFDGRGHTVSGLYLPGDVHTEGGGLFGRVSKATVCNVSIADSLLIAADEEEAGLLAAQCSNSVIQNCQVSGRVSLRNTNYGGGVIGYAGGKNAKLKDCSFSGSLTAQAVSGQVGGVCGYLACPAEGLENHGALELKDSPFCDLGGIAGAVSRCALTRSSNSGSVTTRTEAGSVGGICGQLSAGLTWQQEGNLDTVAATEISGCVNSGRITADSSELVGGIAGSGFNCFRDCGQVTLRDCGNTGTVTGLSKVGGIVGELYLEYSAYQIENCENAGSVEGQSRVGGVAGSVGVNKGPSAMDGCENRGSVTAAEDAGGILGWGADMNLDWQKETDSGALSILRCRNSGAVTVDSGTAGGILGRLIHPGGAFTVDISRCENTGTVHSTGSGRLGGILGGCTAGYVIGRDEGAACYVRYCVNGGTLSYGDAAVNAAAPAQAAGGDDQTLNATEKALSTMSGSAAGGIVGASFQTVVESCLNRGQILLSTGTTPIRNYAEHSAVSGESATVFAGGIYGLFLYSPTDPENAFEREHITDCAYTGGFDAPAYAPFLQEESPVISGNRRISEEEAQALAEEMLR